MTRLLAPLLLLAACSSEGAYDGNTNDDAPTPADTDPSGVQLRVDVLPASVREDDSLGGDFRVLPQTFLPSRLTETDLSLGTLELLSPAEQTGTVTGYRTNPEIALIPGTEEPVDATVWMRAPGTIQSTFTSTDTGGSFSMWILPSTDYRLEIVPTDPLFPVWATELPVGASPVDLSIDLGPGVPVYGRVTSETGPVVGAKVHVVDALGLTSSSAESDAYGLYQVRVNPGEWTVVCEGRDLGTDPTLTIPDVTVGDVGVNVDFVYPTLLETVLVEGHLVTETGTTPAGTTVRFTAESLEGFEDVATANTFPGVTATWVGETPVSESGVILTRVVAGTYTVEVLPPAVDAGVEFSPARMTHEVFVAPQNPLGELTLTALVPVSGRVVQEAGGSVADAVITCVESGYDHRFWAAVADADGVWAHDLPETEVTCEVRPPSGLGLATIRNTFDPSVETSKDFLVPSGVPVTGTVLSDGVPEVFAVVNVYDLDDTLLGFGITGDDGAFSIPVELEGARVTE